MIVPTVHMNGTSKDELLRQIEIAHAAINHAIEGLAGAAPNARDYYVQGPGAFPQARAEHEARMHKLSDVMSELLALNEAIYEQGGK